MNHEDMYAEILENIREGAYFTDTEKRILYWNRAAESITGYSRDEILGKQCQYTPLNHINSDGNLICVAGCPLHKALADSEQRIHDVFVRHKDGHRIAVTVNTYAVKKDGEIVGAFEIFVPHSLVIYDDELIVQLANSATNDTLTGIPNRRRIENFLDLRLREMIMYKNKVCVVFLDIDHFRNFNNTYGHDAGDAVLKTVSDAITRMTRNTDLFGRWGGEEFVGVYTIKEDGDALLVGEKIRATAEATQIIYGDLSLSVTVSIGVTVACSEDTIDTVVKRADSLMYQSKQNGKNRVTADTQ